MFCNLESRPAGKAGGFSPYAVVTHILFFCTSNGKIEADERTAFCCDRQGGFPVNISSTDTCCLTLPLKLEKWQEDRLAKRFEIARQLYNTLVHAGLKLLAQGKRTAEYREYTVCLQGQKS